MRSVWLQIYLIGLYHKNDHVSVLRDTVRGILWLTTQPLYDALDVIQLLVGQLNRFQQHQDG